jgi:outer membrane protein OmpA-like peptidoglycan-associated protein
MHFRACMTAVLCICLAACSAARAPGPAADADASGVELRLNPGRKRIAVSAPGANRTVFEAIAKGGRDYYRLGGAFRSREGYGGFDLAYDEFGNELDLVVEERITTPRGAYIERFWAYLPRELVRNRTGDGLAARAVGEGGEVWLRCPEQRLRAALRRFDAALAERGVELPASQARAAPEGVRSVDPPPAASSRSESGGLFTFASAEPAPAAPPPSPARPPQEKKSNDHIRIERSLHGDRETVVFRNVRFLCGKTTLLPRFKTALRELARELARRPELAVVVEGHTCNVGPAEVNLELSRRRAQAVRDYLAGRPGVDGSRVRAVGRGEDDPEFGNDTKFGRAMNRRVVIQLVK